MHAQHVHACTSAHLPITPDVPSTQVLTSAVDVADAAAMSAFVAQVESEAGIDLVVANAGVMAEDLPLGQALRQVGSINVTGMWALTEAGQPVSCQGAG